MKAGIFRFQFGLSFGYFDDNFGAGLIFSLQSDLTKFKTSPSRTITDEQKHRNSNTVGFFFRLKL
jgi:hypothetical protein